MSAAEDDTELRDLLLQNLENSGVLSRLKAQMRAAVFLAMEEQDRVENKAPLVNENLKNCLNTRDGRAAASLVLDFLQVFDLDFTLSVFEPEMNTKQLESRDLLCKDLQLNPGPKSPVLLELLQRRDKDLSRDQSRDQSKDQSKDLKDRTNKGTEEQGRERNKDQAPSEKQLQWLRQNFDFYLKDKSASSLNKHDVVRLFSQLFPHIHSLNRFSLRLCPPDSASLQRLELVLNWKVLEQFVLEELSHTTVNSECDWDSVKKLYLSLFSLSSSVVEACGEAPLTQSENKGDSALDQDLKQDLKDQKQDLKNQQQDQRDLRTSSRPEEPAAGPEGPSPGPDLDDVDDGDSFFDDPLPAPQKTYGWKPDSPVPSLSLGPSSSSEPSRPGASKAKELKDSKVLSDRSGSHRVDVEYDDDFNSHRSSLSRSELSIGEEIEEVSIEGPELSDKFDEKTQDLSLSELSLSKAADYMEEVP
ncbi:hypothetical protein WMY93_015317 [Mugilogobius chulae]|uniref:Centrosomal protein 43 n=1 Tax=Mugilogobius chulae TaxID=88201 RepID=A0AAW0P160_9GOBI